MDIRGLAASRADEHSVMMDQGDDTREWNGPTVSVVLPNYNHAALIARAFRALLDQDHPPEEIIVVDDSSTDDSLRVIQEFAAKSPAIRVLVNSRNLGVIPSLQRGLEAARGRYVYFAAADDWVLPGFLSCAVDLLEAHPRSGLFCAESELVDGETGAYLGARPIARPIRGTGEVPPAEARKLLARMDNWILTGSALFRRDLVIAAGGFDERLGSFADGYLSRKIGLVHGFCFAPMIVATWQIFASGVSRVTALSKAESVLQIVPRLIAADPAFPSWYAETFSRRWRFATSRLALECQPADRALLLSMGARSQFDRAAFGVIWAIAPPALARLAILSWLWFRFRPTALSGVLVTALMRRFERVRQRPMPPA